MKVKNLKPQHAHWKRMAGLLLFALVLLLPAMAMAQASPDGGGSNLGDATNKICGVMGNVHSILKVASIVIVTIAIIFAGYQIAFAHKRISDVAPILIGGLLIGAAGQLAAMVIGAGDDFKKNCTTTSYIVVESPVRNA
ncbi:type VI secretion protein [Lysobacter pythonis]|uniref:Type VI secretion protein n=1 Tax=Solilutibacter pythonis TaxID=2483112 RepID=A0A3M2HXT1_9GAMM|nr:TrbC/VirB2 family protein [Lysobacter pythonis]RMH90987.1 type VI secretion protein [Lysobacter pythonis]